MTKHETKPENHYQNDHLAITVKRDPGCLVKLEINVKPQATEAAYLEAIKVVNKEVSIPGFRKGRAPDAMILKNYGSYVEQEWKDILLNTSFKEALTLTGLSPFTKNSIRKPTVSNASRKEGAHLSIEFEAFPEVPSVSADNLSLSTVTRKEVTEDEVDKAIENIRLNQASWEEIVERPVEEGDYVEIDINTAEEPVRNLCKKTRFEVSKGKMGEWMRKLVIGMRAGEETEGTSEKDEHTCNENCTEDHHEEPKFIPTRCKITLHSIQKPILPELDNELAKKVQTQTVDELRTKIRDDLNKKADKEVRQKLVDQIRDQITQHYAFDLPSTILRESEEEQNDCRILFIARKMAEQGEIQVTQAEVFQELLSTMWEGGSFDANLLQSEEARSQAYFQALVNKALNHFVDKVSNSGVDS